MKIWLKFVIAHPLITLSLLALTTAALAPGVLKLTFNNRLEAFMPKGDIDYIENEKTKEIYGNNSRYFVISVPKKGDEATFFSEFETLIQDLEAFQTFPGPYLKTDLTRLKALIQKRSLHIKELETHFASSPLFLRLVKRELPTQKGDKTRFTAKEIQKTVQEVEKKIALMAQEPLKRIVSPFTVSDIRASGDEIFTGPILSQNEREERILPKGPFERQRFLNRLSANPSFESGIYATNGKGEITDFGVIVTFTPTTRVDEISRAVIDICLDRPLLSVLPQGSPVINVWFNTYMQTDLKRFLPLVILVMALTFLLNFRSPEGLFLPLTALITSTVWIMGFMGHFGFAITPLGISLPSLMVSVGSSYAIHIYNQYLSERATFQQATFSQDLLSATKHIAPTVLFASLTTIIAFATLASSKLSAVREWGLLSALGVLFSMVVATSLIPSVLVLRHQKKSRFPLKKVKKTGSHPVDLVIRSLIHLATQHPRGVVAATLVLLIFCMAGIFRVQVESDFLTYFKKSDYVRTSAQVVDDKFKGRWGLNLLLNSGAAGGALTPSFLKEIERVRGELSSEERKGWSIGRTDAITDFLKIMNRA
ncbi:MAG: MMPL family transporter, partial [Desulfobacterales bacterium]|nr:MMPL family transporter [Desulfobacterales bacterium]